MSFERALKFNDYKT